LGCDVEGKGKPLHHYREYIEELYDGERLEELITNGEETKLPIRRSEFELAFRLETK